jgi:hypothetical protein
MSKRGAKRKAAEAVVPDVVDLLDSDSDDDDSGGGVEVVACQAPVDQPQKVFDACAVRFGHFGTAWVVKQRGDLYELQLPWGRAFAHASSLTDITEQKLFAYPSETAKGSVIITQADLMRLSPGQYLNDNLVDFSFKHYMDTILPEGQRSRVHIFSTYFYKQLAAGKHQSVSRWTRHMDIFEKEFLLVPINDKLHWSLAIICNPGVACAAAERRDALEKKERAAALTDPADPTKAAGDLADPADVADAAETADASDAPDAADAGRRADALPCIMMFDSLKCHHVATITKVLRAYLNTEWSCRKKKKQQEQEHEKELEMKQEQKRGQNEKERGGRGEGGNTAMGAAAGDGVDMDLSEGATGCVGAGAKAEAAGAGVEAENAAGPGAGAPAVGAGPGAPVAIPLTKLSRREEAKLATAAAAAAAAASRLAKQKQKAATAAGAPFTTASITGFSPPSIPLQKNHCDCGVFMLEYARKFLEDPPLTDEVFLQDKGKVFFGPNADGEDWLPQKTTVLKRIEMQQLLQQLLKEVTNKEWGQKKTAL